MKTYILPEREQFEQIMSMDYDGPIFMLNLLKFKPDGGRESYQRYIEEGAPIFDRIGLQIIYRAHVGQTVIGREAWDEVIIAKYPSVSAFLDMNRDKDYQKAVQHRTEALLDSRLILMRADQAEFPFAPK